MQDLIRRKFHFETPVIVDGKFIENVTFSGSASTFPDDKDLTWLTYTLEKAMWNNRNQADLIKWMGGGKVEGLIDHMIREHLKWLFADLKQIAA